MKGTASRWLQLLHVCWVSALFLGHVTDAPAAAPPLRALFLGDRGHHRPADRFQQIEPVLASRGIQATYTEGVGDLNPTTLGRYDVLIIYANIDTIAPDQEKALLDFVAGGGGFVPIHCASFCFRNSQAYIDLVGAQFQRHGTGEFETKIVDPGHPIIKGFEPFRTWDETYVHTRHNEQNRQVLQVRAEGDREEPWTWVRTHGKGRVFYTAYGHDARTWEKPGFHDLLERGLRWAAARGEVFDSRPRIPDGLKPLTFVPAKIPNYIPAAKWGTQGEPINRMQEPIAPAESMAHMVVPRGFEVRLFAAEPLIGKPVAMAWDHRGRLWIAETVDYPNDKQPEGQGRDRIRIVEDTDGDGMADKTTVFAEKLSLPLSLAFAHGGVVVHQVPETLFLKDNDGDDRADVRKVLFTGWDTRDTHAGPSNLRWGLDNWLYSMDGYSGLNGEVGGERVRFRQGFFRFTPDGSKIEYLRSTNNNSWGVGFSEEGLVLGSTANGCPSVYLPIPNRYYERVRGWSPRVLENIAPTYSFYPATDKVRQVDWFGGFTAAAGHALYTARAYPEYYWNNTAFICEPTGHLTATFTLQRTGSDVRSYYGWNLLASDDEWTAPIVAEVGPDGFVWVIDWYNFIVQHNPTPKGFNTGKGNAYEIPLRDKTHGRIYRIVYREGKPSAPVTLDPDDPKALLAGLKSDNQLWRMHGQRLLVERGKKDVVPELIALVNDRSVDAIGLNPAAIHALWTLHGLGALDGPDNVGTRAAVAALKHPSAGVRRNAVQVLPHDQATTRAILAAKLLEDPVLLVRLAALLALADQPRSQAAAEAIVAVLTSGQAAGDPWLGDAATSAAAMSDREFLAAIAAATFPGKGKGKGPDELSLAVVQRVVEHYARGGPVDSIAALLATLPGADRKVAEAIIAGLGQGWPRGRSAAIDEATESALVRFLPSLGLAARGQLVHLAGGWGRGDLEKYAAEIAAGLRATVADASKPDAVRADAARQWVELRPDAEGVVQALFGLITPQIAPELATGLLEAIGRSAAPQAGRNVIDRLAALTPAARPAALRQLLARRDWTILLLDGVEEGKVRLDQLTLDQKQALAAHRDRRIAGRARELLGRGGLPDPDRQKVIDELGPVVLRGGNAARGKQIFEQQCVKCHTHSGAGAKVGPDLTGMATHPKDELLVYILDPSRAVEGTFLQYTVATADGRILNGLLASETKTAIELVDAEGQRHSLQRADIEELTASKKSLMPDGFEKQLGTEGLADVLEFLAHPGPPH
jgi:putative membrane-bound dehydrogenase-like protein